MGDVIGRLFREFAVTLAVSILISALTLADADPDDERPAPETHSGRKNRAAFSMPADDSSTGSSKNTPNACNGY